MKYEVIAGFRSPSGRKFFTRTVEEFIKEADNEAYKYFVREYRFHPYYKKLKMKLVRIKDDGRIVEISRISA